MSKKHILQKRELISNYGIRKIIWNGFVDPVVNKGVIAMSWYNPSQDEAAEEYYASKSRYANAANQRASAIKTLENYSAEKNQALSAIESCRSDKLNFEKRIIDIKTIIGAIEGSGGGSSLISAMGADLPTLINQFNGSAQQTDTSYQGSIICKDLVTACFLDVFKNKTVFEDSLLSGSLEMFRNEVLRLQEALQNLEEQLNNLTNMVGELTSKINMYQAEQADWRKVMVSSAYEMNHFKNYM